MAERLELAEKTRFAEVRGTGTARVTRLIVRKRQQAPSPLLPSLYRTLVLVQCTAVAPSISQIPNSIKPFFTPAIECNGIGEAVPCHA
jgi:hypothetical protein